MTSNVNDLRARLQQRAETERQEMDAIAARELRTFGERLRGSANDTLRITAATMTAEIAWLEGLLLRGWLRPLVIGLVVGLGLFLGIFGGSWGLMQWQSSRVQRLIETQEALRLAIAQDQQALDQLQAQTWGVWLHEAEDGTRHVVLPAGTFNAEWPWTVRGLPAVRLLSE